MVERLLIDAVGLHWRHIVHSDFHRARLFLERALDVLQGGDEISVHAREALDLLIEACAVKEFSRANLNATNVRHFPNRAREQH